MLVRIEEPQDIPPFVAPRQAYVVFNDGVSEAAIADAHAAAGATILQRHPRRPWMTVQLPGGANEFDAANAYRQRAEVAWASPNYNVTTIDAEPVEWQGDPTIQYWLPQTNSPVAWDTVRGSRKAIVAVLDDGFGYHDEIEENIFLNVKEFPSLQDRTPDCQDVRLEKATGYRACSAV